MKDITIVNAIDNYKGIQKEIIDDINWTGGAFFICESQAQLRVVLLSCLYELILLNNKEKHNLEDIKKLYEKIKNTSDNDLYFIYVNNHDKIIEYLDEYCKLSYIEKKKIQENIITTDVKEYIRTNPFGLYNLFIYELFPLTKEEKITLFIFDEYNKILKKHNTKRLTTQVLKELQELLLNTNEEYIQYMISNIYANTSNKTENIISKNISSGNLEKEKIMEYFKYKKFAKEVIRLYIKYNSKLQPNSLDKLKYDEKAKKIYNKDL